MSQQARKLLDTALKRRESKSHLVQKDLTRVRKFFRYVFEEDNNKEYYRKQHCFRGVDHTILPALGVLLTTSEIDLSTVPTLQAFCSEASKSIKSLDWHNAPELWEACLGVVSSSDIYLKFRKTAVDVIRNGEAGASSHASTPPPPATPQHLACSSCGAGLGGNLLVGGVACHQEAKIGHLGALVATPATNNPTPKRILDADAALMAALPSNTGENGATFSGSQEAHMAKRRREELEGRPSQPQGTGNRTPSQEIPRPPFSFSHDHTAVPQFSQSSPGRNPTSQTYSTESQSSYPGPAIPPPADTQPERIIWQILCLALTDAVVTRFSAVRLISDLARSRQEFALGQGRSNILQCYYYIDDFIEMEIHLGSASKQSCLQAANQIQEMYRGLPGVSVAVEEVRQVKIAMPPSPESTALVNMFF